MTRLSTLISLDQISKLNGMGKMGNKKIDEQIFIKNGYLFEALLEVEENGISMIKALQLGLANLVSNNIIEIPSEEVKLYSLKDSGELQLFVGLENWRRQYISFVPFFRRRAA